MAKKKTKAAESTEDQTILDPSVIDQNDDQNDDQNNDQNDDQNGGQDDGQSSTHYIGPNYKVNIIMYPNDPIDPRNMTNEQIEATKKKYPRTAAWWKN